MHREALISTIYYYNNYYYYYYYYYYYVYIGSRLGLGVF